MKLTEKQKVEIKNQLDSGVALETILLAQFPNLQVSVIRGYDHFDYDAYTKDAFFDEAAAEKAMAEIKPNGSAGLTDTYHILTGALKSIALGEIRDEKTGQPLDRVDMCMLYTSLKEKLRK